MRDQARALDALVQVEGGMPAVGTIGTVNLQAFAAAKLGLMVRTTAQVRQIMGPVGRNFELRTLIMPLIDR